MLAIVRLVLPSSVAKMLCVTLVASVCVSLWQGLESLWQHLGNSRIAKDYLQFPGNLITARSLAAAEIVFG